ncbi:hypothetical protein BK022_22445 [Methylorubrum extorquens]|uniref:Uncharacterized protein n=1 Tax=Methylorubrum extorquens TaxID=408 RepID=A0A1S1NZZ3_METEX|nr:hypothetical protein BK022_22445 [Methylorubrum extorquens]
MEAVEQSRADVQFDVHAEVKAINDASGADAVEGYKRTGLRIQSIVAIIRAVSGSPELEAAFDLERRRHQVQPPQLGANPYYPYVRVCEGEWAPDEGTTEFDGLTDLPVWKPNPSSLKYAQVIREALLLKWPTQEVARRIRDYVNPETGKPGINGMIQADSARHKRPRGSRGGTWKQGEKERAAKAPSLGSIVTSDESFVWTNDYALAIVRKGKSGTVDVIMDAGITGSQVVRAVQMRVLADAK